MSTLLKNAQYLTPDCRTWQQAHILLRDGRIAGIGVAADSPADEVIDCAGKLVIPGFINGHCHSYTGYLKGTIDNVPLDVYMLHAIAGGSHRTDREIYVSAAIESLAMLKRGTTAAVDHFSQRPSLSAGGLDAAVSALKDTGLRGRVATMFADKGFFDTLPLAPGELPAQVLPAGGGKGQSVEEYIGLVEQSYLKYKDDPLVGIILGTDGPQRCSDELLLRTGELEAKYAMGWQTHILEAKTQAIVSRSFYGKGLIEHMDELGVINDRTSLVHHVWVSDPELERVRDRGAAVVHCPSSNLHLGSGVAPVPKYAAMGIPVALGSDGGNCGGTGMLDQIKLTALLHDIANVDYEQWFSADQALRMDYEGGARLFREDIGRIAPGALADIVILNCDNVFWQPVNNLTRQLVYYENGSNVDTVFVAGRKVIAQGQSTLLDEDALVAEAREICEKLRRDCAPAFRLVEQQTPYIRQMYLREMGRDIHMDRFLAGR